MKYAYLKIDYERESGRMRNYGDDIQMYAVANIYRHMGIREEDLVRITLQELFTYDGDEYLLLPISYPLFGNYIKLSEKIIPVYLAISLLSDSAIDSLRLREFEPIGCRDQYTLDLLRNKGVNAYLNGCMTLTLPKTEYTDRNKVFIVDVCDELLPYIPERLKNGAEYLTHLVYHKYVGEAEALSFYERYQKEAKLVITSRLHCAVPCMAYGIPVVYACKAISFRSVWLQKLIPLYDIHSFADIDWDPKPLEIEPLKKQLIDNAILMIQRKKEQFESQLRISEFYEDKSFTNYEVEAMRYSMEYLRNNWKADEAREYVIWGITQTSELLYQYISKNYKNAKLVGVIDLYRKTEFHGITTEGLSLLDNSTATVFVTVESANVMASKLMQERNYLNYVLCWQKQDYKLPL